MLQEKCCRDIAGTLHKALAKSFLSEFASRLNVNLNDNQENFMQKEQLPVQAGKSALQSSKVGQQQIGANQTSLKTQEIKQSLKQQTNENQSIPENLLNQTIASGSAPKVDLMGSIKNIKNQQSALKVTMGQTNPFAALNQTMLSEYSQKHQNQQNKQQSFDPNNPRKFLKQVKKLQTASGDSMEIKRRQKEGQLMIGDIILLNFKQGITTLELAAQRYQKAIDTLKFNPKKGENIYIKKPRELNIEDFIYKAYFHSNGISDAGFKVIPQINADNKNAACLFKQCLFRIDAKQECFVSNLTLGLIANKEKIKQKLAKLVKEKGGEQNISQAKLIEIKEELASAERDVKANALQLETQQLLNAETRKMSVGQKITYGMPFQLYHLFTDKYLATQVNNMSKAYGCCQVDLQDVNQNCWFTFFPSNCLNRQGQVVNYFDRFFIRTYDNYNPFYLQIFVRPNDDYDDTVEFEVNASIEPSQLKAKLFMTWEQAQKEKLYLQSGDVVRIKQVESDSFLTVSNVKVDDLLPKLPDFLQKQIQKSINKKEVYEQDEPEKKEDEEEENFEVIEGFEIVEFTQTYFSDRRKKLQNFSVYLELDQERLQFTNSCWEIQKVNPFQGGNIEFEELVRLRHCTTGYYLCLGDDKIDLQLKSNQNSLNTLFSFVTDFSTFIKPQNKHTQTKINQIAKSGMRFMLKSFVDDTKFLQLFEKIESSEVLQFIYKLYNVDKQFQNIDAQKESQLRVVNHIFSQDLKEKQMFIIHEISAKDAYYSERVHLIFDQILIFYIQLNQWGVKTKERELDIDNFVYDGNKAIDDTDFMSIWVDKITTNLNQLEKMIFDTEIDVKTFSQLRDQLKEQGILDILFRVLQLIYFKTIPANIFQQPFYKQKSFRHKFVKDLNPLPNPAECKIEHYIAHEIAREHLTNLIVQILRIISNLIKNHRHNSETSTKYLDILLLMIQAQEYFHQITLVNNIVKFECVEEIVKACRKLTKKIVKNSVYIENDRLSCIIVDIRNQFQDKKYLRDEKRTFIDNKLNYSKNNNDQFPDFIAIDTVLAKDVISRSKQKNHLENWLNLLEPIHYIDNNKQNIMHQTWILQILAEFCKDANGRGNYFYQLQIMQHIFAKEENVLLRYGTARVGNCLRPFVYFTRPKDLIPLQLFLEYNPLLGDIQDNFNMQQRKQNQYELIFDLHEISKNYG